MWKSCEKFLSFYYACEITWGTMKVINNHMMCKLKINCCKYIIEFLWLLKTPSLYKNKLLYECTFSWNKIVKKIEILILKGFDVIIWSPR